MSLTLTRRHNVDRFGYLIPTKYGNVPMVGAVATYRPGEGRFGGAVAVEEGTTNLANNPTFSGAVGMRPSGWHSDVTIQQDDFFGQLINVAELLCVSGNAYEDFGSGIAYPLAHNTTYTISFWARGTMELSYEFTTRGIASATWKSRPPMSLQWRRYEVTIVTASSGSIYPFWWFLYNVNDVNVGKWVRIARIQLEQKPFATSFVDGTRADGILSFPVESFPQGAFTFSCWLKATGDNDEDSNKRILSLGPRQNSRLTLWLFRPTDPNDHRRIIAEFGNDDSGVRQYTDLTSATPWSTNEYELFAVTFDGANTFKFYRNGELWHQYSPSKINSITEFALRRSNWLIDELLILPYAASEEEIRSWYEADGPLPPHPDALLQWDWQAVRPATMVAL